MQFKLILDLILIGAQVLKSERQQYFKSKVEKLFKEIQEVEDSDFYHKDMEKKGIAERELELQTHTLVNEFIKDAGKK